MWRQPVYNHVVKSVVSNLCFTTDFINHKRFLRRGNEVECKEVETQNPINAHWILGETSMLSYLSMHKNRMGTKPMRQLRLYHNNLVTSQHKYPLMVLVTSHPSSQLTPRRSSQPGKSPPLLTWCSSYSYSIFHDTTRWRCIEDLWVINMCACCNRSVSTHMHAGREEGWGRSNQVT